MLCILIQSALLYPSYTSSWDNFPPKQSSSANNLLMKPSVLLPACELLWAAPGCFQERKSFVSGWYTLRCHLAPSLRSVDKTVEKIFWINTVEIAEPCVGKVQLTFLTRMERSWTKSLRRLWRVWSSRAFDITGKRQEGEGAGHLKSCLL